MIALAAIIEWALIKKKSLKAVKLVKHAARKTAGQPKATRVELSKIEKFKGGHANKRQREVVSNYESSQ